ncbi:MAG: glycoside hydrolase family 55 protein, partial [Cytophagales bacterium]|nr:glycoside hydrolase family 55 protein [Cytophagales bacterium]
MNFKLRMTLALSLGIVSMMQAQTWRSKLYPVDWKPQGNFYTDKIIQDFSYAGYRRGEKAIPINTANTKNVTLPPYSADKTGATDVTAKIQKAIDDVSAAGGGVVYLPAGTYKVSPGSNTYCIRIGKSNVILRGDGPNSTFILNSSFQMNSKSIVSVQGGPNWYGTTTNQTAITADLTGPTQVIPVQNASGYQKGDLVVLRNNITDQWINEHN